MLTAHSQDVAFISKGYINWKDATGNKRGFKQHEQSECHKEAHERYVSLRMNTKDVGESLTQQHKEEKKQNRASLLKILSSLKYLARQGLAMRGDGSDEDSNFKQLLYLRAEDDPNLAQWLKRKGDRYTSPPIQNEVLKIMALKVLRDIRDNIQGSTFSLYWRMKRQIHQTENSW